MPRRPFPLHAKPVVAFVLAVASLALPVVPAETPATSQPLTNALPTFALPSVGPSNDADNRYQKLLAADNAAQAEVDGWIQEADRSINADLGALQAKIDHTLKTMDTAYEEFLAKFPDHVEGRIAYGSFLNDTGREQEAKTQWELALARAPENPVIYNNLAGIYGHRGPVTNAFVLYEKAMRLAPEESLYAWNLATVTFLFRRDVMSHYQMTNEQQVFDKSLALYQRALDLAPTNFILASDLAQSYYLIQPQRTDAALAAWRRALRLASDDLERQGVHVHLARTLSIAGQFDASRRELDRVTLTNYADLKLKLLRTIERRESATATAAPPNAASATESVPTP